jgi:ACS family hexuronate transporter-like MFS transporter
MLIDTRGAGRRWFTCGFLFLATVLNFLDRQTLSIAAPLIQREFSLNNEQLGLLLSAFLYSYAVTQVAAGWMLDRFSIRWVYAIAVALWSLAGAATGLARSFWQLFGFRVLLGGFESANWPAAARIVHQITTRSDRAFANGIFNSGISVGALVAPGLMIWLFNAIGWRAGFCAVGAVGLLWCAGWLGWTKNGLGQAPDAERQEEPHAAEVPWSRILRSPRLYVILIASAFGNAIFYFSVNWIATYMVQTYQLEFSSRLSLLLTLVYVGMDIGYLGGGALVMPLAARGMGTMKARKMIMAVAAAVMCSAAVVPWLGSPTAAAAMLCLLNIGRGAWGSNFFTFTQEICPAKVAILTGLSGCAGALGGALFVWFVGYASQTGGYRVPFLVLGVLPIFATAPLLLMRRDSGADAKD